MTIRPEELSRLQVDDGSHRFSWLMRFKGVYGRGIYGFVTTDWQGRGLYLLAEGDLPGVPGYQERMTCLVPPADFQLEADTPGDEVREKIVAVLLALGWGPRVGHGQATAAL